MQYFDFEEIRKFEDRVEDDNIFKSYLNNIIPKIKTIFNNYKNNIVSGVSFDRVLKQLEPFLIYKDDITFKQYHLIMDFVNNEINKVKQIIVNKSKYTKYLSEIIILITPYYHNLLTNIIRILIFLNQMHIILKMIFTQIYL